MALPKEPRQKMINIMYLVLTALLALNVSAEILNAFKTVDNSLTKSSKTVSASTDTYIASLKEKLTKPETSEKANIWYPKAQQAQQLTASMYNFLDGVKDSILVAADFDPKRKGDSTFKQDNLDISTRILADGKLGDELFQKLADYKKQLLAIDPSIAKEFAASLPIDLTMPKVQNKENNTLQSAYFRMTPVIATITMLSKFQNDVKTSENKVIEFCHKQVGQVEVVFDAYQPLVGQTSNYLMPGQEMTITAGIGAYNKSAQPTISIDGSNVPLNASGVAEYKVTAGGTGSYTKNIHISYFNQATGKTETKDVPISYTVGSPTGASVSADDVKVLYIGLDNHLSISGGNVGDEKVHVSFDNGQINKSAPGKYVVQPSKPGVGNITLNIDGQGKPQVFTFKVKTVPDPVAKVGNNKGGRINTNEFKAQAGVRADLENFVFEGVKFNVVSYTVVCTGAGFPTLKFQQVNGASFEPARNLIDLCRAGSTVTIDEIKAVGPGGNTRTLPPIVFNLF